MTCTPEIIRRILGLFTWHSTTFRSRL